MKYSELPKQKLIQKLILTSFESPSANRDVYNWCESISKHIQFLENERIKLVKKYGEDDGNGNIKVATFQLGNFGKAFSDLINMEIDEEIKPCPVKEDWFDDNKCSYPAEKEMWITPAEIGILKNL